MGASSSAPEFKILNGIYTLYTIHYTVLYTVQYIEHFRNGAIFFAVASLLYISSREKIFQFFLFILFTFKEYFVEMYIVLGTMWLAKLFIEQSVLIC